VVLAFRLKFDENAEGMENCCEEFEKRYDIFDKQTSKKVAEMKCPTCGEQIFFEPVDHKQKTYCWACGQCFDWSDYE
jgi:ribosomal protein S27AE